MATCMYCGGQTPDGTKYCVQCGAALPVEASFDNSYVSDSSGDAPGAPIDVTPTDASSSPYGQAQPYGQQPYSQGAPGASGAQGQAYSPDPSFSQGQTYSQGTFPQQPYSGAPQPGALPDSGSIGWGVLGFFFPLVGIILYFVWRSIKPKCAKVSIMGAIIGIVLNMISYGFLFTLSALD